MSSRTAAKLFTIIFASTLALGAAIAANGTAGETPASGTTPIDMGPDRASAGRDVVVNRSVAGDLLAAGRSVDVQAGVGGDAVVAGGRVQVNSEVKQDVYAAGGRVSVNAPLQGNARLAGGRVDIGPQAHVAGGVSAAGGEVKVLGPIDGYLSAGGGRVLIDAPVKGDVDVRARSLELGPNAHITGRLRYASGVELKRDSAARADGGIEQVNAFGAPSAAGAGWAQGFTSGWGWVWTIGLMVLAAVLAAVLPGWSQRAAEGLRRHAGKSLLVGFLVLVLVPVVSLLLLVTIIGAPLALVTLFVYLAVLPTGYVTTGIALGEMALKRFSPGKAPRRAWLALAAALAVLLIAIAARIPWVGPVVVVAALLVGIGALVMPLRRSAPAGV